MRGEPCSARYVHAPAYAPARRGVAPCVAHGVCHPSAAAVHLARRHGSAVGKHADIAEQRLVAFGQVGAVGSPVVLLYVYVEMIVARPWHVACPVVIPYSLQVSTQRHAARTRRRYEHVASVLKEEGVEHRVGCPCLRQPQACVSGQLAACAIAQGYVHAPEECRIVGHVGISQRSVALACGLVNSGSAELHVVFVVIVGAHIYYNGERIGSLYGDGGVCRAYGSALGQQSHLAAEAHSARSVQRKVYLARQRQPVFRGLYAGLAQQVKTERSRYCSPAAGSVAHGYHVVGIVGYVFPAVVCVAAAERNGHHRAVHVDAPAVVAYLSARISEVGHHVAERQMSAEGAAQSVEIFVAQLVAALRVAVEEAAAHLVELILSADVVVRCVGLSRPQADLAEGYPLAGYASVDHSRQAAVARRHGFHPFAGRLLIP